MLSSFQQELLALQEPASRHFSAVRHSKRELEELDRPVVSKASTVNLLQINSLIASQGDSIMNEAKSLLKSWMDGEIKPSLDDEYVCYDGWMARAAESETNKYQGYSRSKPDLQIQELELEPVVLPPQLEVRKRVKPQDSASALKLKQNMARERRNLIAEKRKLEEMQKSKLAEDIVMADVAHVYISDKLDQEKKAKIIKEELRILKEKERQEQDRKTLYLKESYQKVDAIVVARSSQLKRQIFSSIIQAVQETKKKAKVIALKQAWTLLNGYWISWKKAASLKIERQEMETTAKNLRTIHQHEVKSIKHYRATILSKAILSWRGWVALNREEQRNREAHARRAKKMEEFILQLEEKHREENVGHEVLEEVAERQSNVKKNRIIPEIKPIVKRVPRIRIPVIAPTPIKRVRPSKQDEALATAMQMREQDRIIRKEQVDKKKAERMAEIQRMEEERIKCAEEIERIEREKITTERKQLEEVARIVLQKRTVERQETQQKLIKARIHREKKILQDFGIAPLKALVCLRRRQKVQATFMAESILKRKAFNLFRGSLERKRANMAQQAINFADFHTMQSCWNILQLERQIALSQKIFLLSMFKGWKMKKDSAYISRREKELVQEEIADRHAARSVPRRFLITWKRFVKDQKEDRWREFRRARLREAAQEALMGSSLLMSRGDILDLNDNP